MKLSEPHPVDHMRKLQMRFAERNKWHAWFAWFPVRTIKGQWLWLETVERVRWMSMEIDAAEYLNGSGLFWAYRATLTSTDGTKP